VKQVDAAMRMFRVGGATVTLVTEYDTTPVIGEGESEWKEGV